jgi:hypothetical protein
LSFLGSLVLIGISDPNSTDAPGAIGAVLFTLSVIEFILVPGVFLIGLVCYLAGGDKLVPAAKAELERRTGVQQLRFALAPSAGGAVAGLSFRF